MRASAGDRPFLRIHLPPSRCPRTFASEPVDVLEARAAAAPADSRRLAGRSASRRYPLPWTARPRDDCPAGSHHLLEGFDRRVRPGRSRGEPQRTENYPARGPAQSGSGRPASRARLISGGGLHRALVYHLYSILAYSAAVCLLAAAVSLERSAHGLGDPGLFAARRLDEHVAQLALGDGLAGALDRQLGASSRCRPAARPDHELDLVVEAQRRQVADPGLGDDHVDAPSTIAS